MKSVTQLTVNADHLQGAIGALFKARTVAVVGISADHAKLGNVILRNVVKNGFAGNIYGVCRAPVEPGVFESGYERVRFVQAFSEIEEPVDVALFAVPADMVVTALASMPLGEAAPGRHPGLGLYRNRRARGVAGDRAAPVLPGDPVAGRRPQLPGRGGAGRQAADDLQPDVQPDAGGQGRDRVAVRRDGGLHGQQPDAPRRRPVLRRQLGQRSRPDRRGLYPCAGRQAGVPGRAVLYRADQERPAFRPQRAAAGPPAADRGGQERAFHRRRGRGQQPYRRHGVGRPRHRRGVPPARGGAGARQRDGHRCCHGPWPTAGG